MGDAAIAPQPVFADVDTGVDDALALVYLLAGTDAELVGIASTGGNVAVDQVCVNNLGLLELCQATAIPVSRGAGQSLRGLVRSASLRAENIHGPQGLGYAELAPCGRRLTGYDSASAWVRAAHAHPGRLIGVVTGPLTNLALALRAEPALPTLLHRLVIMGGSFGHHGNITPAAEFNIGVDPEAAAEVFEAWETQGPQRLPIMCGLELTEHVAMTPAILGRLAASAGSSSTAPMNELEPQGLRSATSNPLIRVIEDAMRFYFEAHYDRGRGYLAYLHDPLAVAVALEPELVTTRAAAVHVKLADTPARGATAADWSARKPNARIGVDVDPDAFFDRFIERVGTFARRLG